MASKLNIQEPNPKRLKTLAFNVADSEGNNLLHKFVLDNSEPNVSGSENYINAVLLSISGTSVDVNALNAKGYSPLHLAVIKKNLLMVKKLLSCLVNIDVDRSSLWTSHWQCDTALHYAAVLNDLPMIQELLNKGADVNAGNVRDCTALCFAANLGNLDLIKLLVSKGANVNIHGNVDDWTEEGHVTPLHSAAYSGKVEAVKFLVSNGAALDALDEHNGTILHYAAMGSCDLATVEFLVSSGADVNAKDGERFTPLHFAVNYENLEVVKCLIRSGADLNAKNNIGFSPLHYAAKSDNVEVVKCLLRSGADLNAKDENGCTPLHYVIISSRFEYVESYYGTEDILNIACNNVVIENSYKRLDVIEMLLKNGSNVNAKDKHGKTPLHMAVSMANYVYTRCLLERGACVNVTDTDGWTPLHAAAHVNHAEIIRWLLDKNADKNAKNNNGKTPLDLAIESEHELCTDILQ